ncbi:succinate dehydrogenase [Spongiactinospora rosea]|uniref:Succinate dehydrogenase n=1 Tax=Spongiactinospora rosea TaxID=2248750 RepID=A0A366LX77_9ACTN|nr:succinate dehydrogenase cytochrome b subunit [Spongiactinospora rosea]RBQ18568.1 succinate dehydrogenase [Spongiactinospora rosea]
MTATIERGAATAPVASHEPPRPPTAARNRKGGFFRSSNGKKAVMAVTGAVMVLYLIAHMAGNLKIFFGATDFNEYAAFLREIGHPLVPYRTVLTLVEVVLAVSVVLHMWSAVSLARRASRARPVKYAARPKSQASGYAVQTMRYGGVIILLFVIWHLLDLTFVAVNPAGPNSEPYQRLVQGFAIGRWPVTLFYVVALLMVGLHLRHGLWSAFQTLGLAGGRRERPLKLAAAGISALLVLGFLSVPLSITIGLVK